MSFRLYLVTPHARAEVVERVEVALRDAPPGAVAVQLRDEAAGEAQLLETGRRLRDVTAARGAALFVNGSIDVARGIDADGVHLPEAGPAIAAVPRGLRIGCSRHDRAGLMAAERAGAGFACLSPIHRVPGKGAPMGVEGFAAAIAGLELPVYALGGVTAADARAIAAAGGAGVAVIRAVFDAPDPAGAVAALLEGARIE